MRRANIRFDDPDDPSQSSSLCIDLTMRLMALDFARRSLERKGDPTSLRRAEELRKYFRQTVLDSVTAIRSLVPEEILHEHSRLCVQRAARYEDEEKERRKQERKLARLEQQQQNNKGQEADSPK